MNRLGLILAVGFLQIAAVTPFWMGNNEAQTGNVTPVVIIPGTGGNQLEAKLNRQHVLYPHCEKTKDWFRLWLDVWSLARTKNLKCWCDNMKTYYDPKTGKTTNTPGVETRVQGWGETSTVEYLDPSWSAWAIGADKYMEPLIKEMVSWGHVKGKTVRAAPYDFRYAPHSQPEYFQNLKTLIEETYKLNNNKKVAVFAHSMGGLFGLYFFKQQTQDWKNQYVHSYISSGTPYEGVAMQHRLFVSGYNMAISVVESCLLREQQRSQETNVLMLAKFGTAFGNSDVIVQTPEKSYTAADTEEVMRKSFPVGVQMMQHYKSPDYKQENPGVPFHCFVSNGVDTAEKFTYKNTINAVNGTCEDPTVTNGDGDGTVNYKSLIGCEKMSKPGAFKLHQTSGASHVGMLSNKWFQKTLKSII